MERKLPEDYSLLVFDNVDSTNEEAKRLIRAKMHGEDSEKTVVWAKSQNSGRGRQGRKWSSPTGNLYLSIILNPDSKIEILSQLSFVAALALKAAIEKFLPKDAVCEYKWPNDLLVNGCKIAGILLENEVVKKGSSGWLVVGVGVNVKKFPKNLDIAATSLKELGCEDLNVEDVMEEVISSFNDKFEVWKNEGFDVVRKEWLASARGIGEEINVSLPKESLSGVFKEINHNGELVLSLGGGKIRLISGGEVFFDLKESRQKKASV